MAMETYGNPGMNLLPDMDPTSTKQLCSGKLGRDGRPTCQDLKGGRALEIEGVGILVAVYPSLHGGITQPPPTPKQAPVRAWLSTRGRADSQ